MSEEEKKKLKESIANRLGLAPEDISMISFSKEKPEENEEETIEYFSFKEERLLGKIEVLKELLISGIGIPRTDGMKYVFTIQNEVYREQLQDYIMMLTQKFLKSK